MSLTAAEWTTDSWCLRLRARRQQTPATTTATTKAAASEAATASSCRTLLKYFQYVRRQHKRALKTRSRVNKPARTEEAAEIWTSTYNDVRTNRAADKLRCKVIAGYGPNIILWDKEGICSLKQSASSKTLITPISAYCEIDQCCL